MSTIIKIRPGRLLLLAVPIAVVTAAVLGPSAGAGQVAADPAPRVPAATAGECDPPYVPIGGVPLGSYLSPEDQVACSTPTLSHTGGEPRECDPPYVPIGGVPLGSYTSKEDQAACAALVL